ncbi:MAG: hypothetical protein RhofKO_41000 [Rhodothermales bacterium]
MLRLALVLLLASFAASPGRAQPVATHDEPGLERFADWFYKDAGALVRLTKPRTALYVAGAAGATLALAQVDDEVNPWLRDRYDGTFKDILEVADYAGGPNVNFIVVGVAGTSLLTKDRRFQDAAMTSLQTLVYAGLVGYGLKGIFGRLRPSQTDDPYAFFETTGKNPFSNEGNSSYPSGHAIASFGIVTPWVLYYPSPFTYALYAIPLGTTLSRLAIYKHWMTDMVAGAAIGILMGRYLSLRHQGQTMRHDVDVAIGPGQAGLTYRF